MFGGFHMAGGWFWIILIPLVLLAGWIAFQTYSNNSSSSTFDKHKGRSKTAHEIADERYANGEISREEYLKIVKDLDSMHYDPTVVSSLRNASPHK